MVDNLHGELAVRGCFGGGLFFHCQTRSSLGKWEKGNTEDGRVAKASESLEDKEGGRRFAMTEAWRARRRHRALSEPG
jgi:hypothetical protein